MSDRSLIRPGAIACLLLSACGGGGPSQEAPASAEPARGGTAVVALKGDLDSWNPYTTHDATSANLLDLLYPRLVIETGARAPGAEFEPSLASAWEFSTDRRNLAFHLRADAVWSNGSPVTCEDVRFTWRVQISEEIAWAGAFLKKKILAVECPDPHTAVFRFSESYADQIVDANDNAIVPASYGAVPLSAWASTPWERQLVSCGPFRLVDLHPAQESVLERDPSWWGAAGTRIDRVVLRVYPDESGAIARLLEGEADLLVKVPPLRAADVEVRPDLELFELPSLSYAYLGWNVLAPGAYAADRRARGCDGPQGCPEDGSDILRLRRERPHPVLADPRVRRALTLAIDRADLIQGLWGGRAREGGSPIVSALWAHDPSSGLPFDPAAAEALLDEAGWRRRNDAGVRVRGAEPMEIRVIVNAENQLRRDALDRVAAGLARLGVRLVPEPLPRREFVARARDKDFDAVLGGWSAGTRIEPQNLLHTRAATQRGNNLTSWSTRASDDLLERAASAPDRARALPLWTAWQEVFREEQPLTILYEETLLVGRSGRIRGPTPPWLNPYLGLSGWWIEERAREDRGRRAAPR